MVHQITINAPATLVYEQLLLLDFNEVWVVRFLESLRTGKTPKRSSSNDLRCSLQGTGFVVLAEIPNQELVMGIAGRFWRLDGGRCMSLTAKDFPEFTRPGYAKVAWGFSLRSASPNKTILSTETRTKCFGSTAKLKFRIYWSLIYPFAGLIRKAILRRIKKRAESAESHLHPQ